MLIEVQLSATPRAPSLARRVVAGLPLGGEPRTRAGGGWRLHDALLLVSELVTNSLVHAGLGPGDAIRLRASSRGPALRVEVADEGPGFSWHERARPEPSRPGGRGLWLVSRLADRWGIERNRATIVWFEIDTSSRSGRRPVRD